MFLEQKNDALLELGGLKGNSSTYVKAMADTDALAETKASDKAGDSDFSDMDTEEKTTRKAWLIAGAAAIVIALFIISIRKGWIRL